MYTSSTMQQNNKLPNSLPKNWPNPSASDLEESPKRLINIGSYQDYYFCNNSIKTSKYEVWSFLPKFLLEEFNPKTKIANCYFLVIAGMQCIPPISNTHGIPTTLLPLVIVLLISAFFKILEDMSRHIADKKSNSSTTEKFNYQQEQFTSVLWSEIEVGDFVRIHSLEVVPADILILQVSEASDSSSDSLVNVNDSDNDVLHTATSQLTGTCYVETKSLDGETNLKQRTALPCLLGKVTTEAEWSDLTGKVEIDHPNNLINHFDGAVEITGLGRFPFNASNAVLRGCVLRNTEWVVGVVVNTGHDVKVMQTGTEGAGQIKTSKLEETASQLITNIVIFLLVICFLGATGMSIFNSVADVDSMWYLGSPARNPAGAWFIQFFYDLLLHASFIPVSLYVTMAVVRYLQSYFMQNDLEMYHSPIDCPALVRTMTLNEELGQVSHIFSDKTGTLTCNVMNFRKASINGVSYGQGFTEVSKAAYKLQGVSVPQAVLNAQIQAEQRAVPHVVFHCPVFDRDVGFDEHSMVELNDINIGFDNHYDNNYYNHSNSNSISNSMHKSGSSNSLHRSQSAVTHEKHTPVFQNLKRRQQKQRIKAFYRYLALCHEVMLEKVEDSSLSGNSNGDSGSLKGDVSQKLNSKSSNSHSSNSKVPMSLAEQRRQQKLDITSSQEPSISAVESPPQFRYSASNPDDEALICAAKFFGYELVSRSNTRMGVRERDTGVVSEVEVLQVLPFSSSRKRMSIIIRDIDGVIRILTKGADAAMIPRLKARAPGSEQEELLRVSLAHLDEYSNEGLRCLMMGCAEVEEGKFAAWTRNYAQALADLREVDKRRSGALNDIDILEDFIENDLELLGVTGIEDRLQQGVPQCIAKLKSAGIKVWVLTGDKEGTAINIAIACNLLLPPLHMQHIIINSKTAPTISHISTLCRRLLGEIYAEQDQAKGLAGSHSAGRIHRRARGLVVDGASLLMILSDNSAKILFAALGNNCQAVVCCRVSPSQKAQVVSLMTKLLPAARTLAVGDGANDVAMITAAHVGVGIRGEEGTQAVNASDYAIGQFRHLTPLLLKHGRFNYIRMCHVILYMFYKNILMSMCMFWFTFACGFSSQKLFTEGAIQLFNLFYTSVPIILYGATDCDVHPAVATKYPQLYKDGIQNKFFNLWMFKGVAESVLATGLSLLLLTDMGHSSDVTFWETGALCFTAVIVIINLKMFFIQHNWHILTLLVLLASVCSWFLAAYVISASPLLDFEFFGLWTRLLGTGAFWVALLIIVVVTVLLELMQSIVLRFGHFGSVHILQELSATREHRKVLKLHKKRQRAAHQADLPDDVSLASFTPQQPLSTMRMTTYGGPEPANMSKEEKNERILARRVVFKWLPPLFHNDLIHGSWYYVWASFLSVLIPIPPLISLYHRLWENADILPVTDHTAAYLLLAFMGVFFTIGSWAFVRAVHEPPKPPLFNWYHFSTDELFAMWCFSAGTAPSVPVMIIYVAWNDSNGEFGLALVVCIVATIATVVFTLSCYPSTDTDKEGHPEPMKLFVNLFRPLFCGAHWFDRHFANDWLGACWMMVLGSAFACVASLALLAYESYYFDGREVFNYATAFVDCVLFLIGSMYLLAGSYPVLDSHHHPLYQHQPDQDSGSQRSDDSQEHPSDGDMCNNQQRQANTRNKSLLQTPQTRQQHNHHESHQHSPHSDLHIERLVHSRSPASPLSPVVNIADIYPSVEEVANDGGARPFRRAIDQTTAPQSKPNSETSKNDKNKTGNSSNKQQPIGAKTSLWGRSKKTESDARHKSLHLRHPEERGGDHPWDLERSQYDEDTVQL